ncbi:type IV pilus assembly PilZ [Geobacter metallireducens RCH3]|uniref:PilZ domain protein n=1 Tax=Geobacter metallireducens (strain ATCC 53774 / DSM 7210 / GS-15) TaxID=269799 RepID=Q39YH2_GEOMG|nr:PilZ-like domain-containing protein [Geobacter metallireducens]ABB30702.1 PilZ domain protein [Geobacter metallireducens GS-15]EHP85509.1 type IV pilus assembly PilZ [Geobacter metallireducens RCH3]
MSTEYSNYFEELQKINVAVRLGGGGSFDGTAAITSLKGDLAWLELYGNEQPPRGAVQVGAETWVSVWTGGALCRCDAKVETVRDDRQFSIRLVGEVKETQRREYFRLDVSLPVLYKVLDTVAPEDAEADWNSDRKVFCRPPEMVPTSDGPKVVDWDGEDVVPVRTNLSGGGMRLRVSRLVESGTLVKLTLFLPLPQPRVIYVVAEALRCQEITLSREPGQHYSMSLKFVMIVDRDREAIISYLFNEQRRELMAKNERVR